MPALDTLGLPALDALLAATAGLLNSLYLPAATPASIVAAAMALACLPVLAWLVRRTTSRGLAAGATDGRLDELNQRFQTLELLLADATSETTRLRQRVDQLTARQGSSATGNARSGLRQAIALSKHGATTRQLVDTCDLSQGEAHLIQTLYGRPPGDDQPEELH